MLVYRIENSIRQDEALSGLGAELYGGRWNTIGEKAVYCATHRSLAMLEVLAHVRHQNLFPVNRVMITIEIPDQHVESVDEQSLDPNWRDLSTYHRTNSVFSNYCLNRNLLALLVPSVIVPEEYNMILNPIHSAFKTVQVMNKKPLEWDQRLLHQA